MAQKPYYKDHPKTKENSGEAAILQAFSIIYIVTLESACRDRKF